MKAYHTLIVAGIVMAGVAVAQVDDYSSPIGGAVKAPVVVEKKMVTKTVTIPLVAKYVVAKGEVGKKWILRWPKPKVTNTTFVASAVVLTADIKGALAGKGEIVAARVMTPIVEGHSGAPTKIGVSCLTAPLVSGKEWNAADVVTPTEGSVIPMQVDAPYNPAKVIPVDATSAVKAAVVGGASGFGLALRTVPDRSVDEGYSVNCRISPKDPITLEIDVAGK